MDYSDLLPFAETPIQKQAIQLIIKHNGIRPAAKAAGKSRSALQDNLNHVKLIAQRRGYSPEHDQIHVIPETQAIRGVSTCYNSEGDVVTQWVKTREDESRSEKLRLEAYTALSSGIKREKQAKAPKSTIQGLVNCYIVTDYHLGMMAWHEESGDDWDIKIAEDLLVKWFSVAIDRSPHAKIGIFAQLGDFLHWDGLDAVTPAHKHVLDADTRFQKIVRVAIRAIRRIIRMLLEKHDQVHIIMAEGNHDPASSIWLREWLTALYDEEPRITVDQSPDPYYCYEHGNTSLFFHHGHKRKPEELDDVFAAKFRDVFGRTKYSFAHVGHLHHDKVIETKLMTVNQHRTLAAPDAYASRAGWMSGRDAKVITYSSEHGEVSRITVSPAMVSSL